MALRGETAFHSGDVCPTARAGRGTNDPVTRAEEQPWPATWRRATTSPGTVTAARSRAPSGARSWRTPRPPGGSSARARTSRSTRWRATRAAGRRCTSPTPCIGSDDEAQEALVTESSDFASGRSTKHNPRVDEELEHEMQGMLKAERSTRAEEWREVEPSAEGDPDVDADPEGTLTGGTPVGMDADAVARRSELARWLDRADFPSDGAALVEAARGPRGPGAAMGETGA